MRRLWMLVAGFIATLALVGCAKSDDEVATTRNSETAAESSWVITDLGTLGGEQSSAKDINERGQVVGWSETNLKDRFGDPTRHAFLWQNGRMIDLGTLGGDFSEAVAVNDRGQVIGRSDQRDLSMHAFLWDKGKMIDLAPRGGESIAWAINDGGQVVGRYRGTRGFLWQKRTMRDLGKPPQGGGIGFWGDIAINERGQIVGSNEYGWTSGDNFLQAAFLWQGGRMIDLGSLGGRHTNPSALNDLGLIVGSSDTKALHGGDQWQLTHAFLWQAGKMRDLGTLGGEESYAVDVNEHGQIVGFADRKSGTWHASLWRSGMRVDLGVLPGSRYSKAVAINERGQVIGYSYAKAFENEPEGYSRAFLWQNGKMIDLGRPDDKLRYNQPVAINDRGQIVGTSGTQGAMYWDAGQYGRHAVLWTLKR